MSILRQEEEGDEDAEAEEAEKAAAAKEPKKKVLKPPGYKKPPLPKPRPKDSGPAGKQTPAAKRSSIGPEDFAVERRTVRESTRQKVEEGELERKLAEKVGGGLGSALWHFPALGQVSNSLWRVRVTAFQCLRHVPAPEARMGGSRVSSAALNARPPPLWPFLRSTSRAALRSAAPPTAP